MSTINRYFGTFSFGLLSALLFLVTIAILWLEPATEANATLASRIYVLALMCGILACVFHFIEAHITWSTDRSSNR